MADKSVALADTEWSIMQIIWDSNPITFREICDVIAETKGWSKHSVASYLKRMEKKGAIMSEPSTSVKKYYPIIDRKSAISRETKSILDRVFNGNPLLMVQTMAEEQGLSDETIEQLTELLKMDRNDDS